MNFLTKVTTAVSIVAITTVSVSAYDTEFNEARTECVELHDIFIQSRDNTAIQAHSMFIKIKCEDTTYTPPSWKSYYFKGKEISKKKPKRNGCDKGCEEVSPFFKTQDEDGNPIVIPHPKEDEKKVVEQV